MTSSRKYVVNERLILQALKYHERSENYEIKELKIENAVGEGENFMGDLFSVKFHATSRPQDDFKYFHWIIKVIAAGEGFNETRFLDNFKKETHIYKVCFTITTFIYAK